MKWQLILFVLVFVSTVQATLNCTISNSTCEATDVYHLSNLTNAHAEQNNESNYNFTVCCNETEGNALNASQGTEIASLSGSTNAHIEQDNESNYNFTIYLNVTGGTISCHYNTSACEEACLGTISSHTNAHSADCTTDPYSINICCKSSITPSIPPPTEDGPGGQGDPPIFTNCTYFLDKHEYFVGEQINFTVFCYRDWFHEKYTVDWQDVDGNLYNRSQGNLDEATSTYFKPQIAMNGVINWTARGARILLPFKVIAKPVSKVFNFAYTLLIGGVGFAFFLLIDKTMKKRRYPIFYDEEEEKKRKRKTRLLDLARVNVLPLVIIAGITYLVMKPTELLGYAYVLAISTTIFIVFLLINRSMQDKPHKAENKIWRLIKVNTIPLLIIAAITYLVMRPAELLGYTYLVGISAAIFIIFLLINRSMQQKEKSWINSKFVSIIAIGIITYIVMRPTEILGYIYLVGMSSAMFFIILAIDNSMQKRRAEGETPKSKRQRIIDKIKISILPVSVIAAIAYLTMKPTELIGYIYVLGISLITFFIILAIDSSMRKKRKKDNKILVLVKSNITTLIVLIGIAYLVMKPTDWKGYLIALGISTAVFIIILLISRQIEKEKKKRGGDSDEF